MSGITTHVLDTAAGRPARGVPVRLEVRMDGKGWVMLAERTTDADGRVKDLLADGSKLDAGVYRITFGTGAYFTALGMQTFFPEASVVFDVSDPGQHHHVPLLLSPFGYSTYRGS
ncbi:MAG TPA: hydroxyisourate hydrolase [Candidatus Eisenbacteria bacterium]|nr:hydroxyisourate hydrolase [Candidatus Eisenbacteria bacterium]